MVGSYPVTYNVDDSEGNSATEVTRTVDVVDTTLPVITLVGANPQVIEVFSGYVELGATALDNYDGDIFGSIVIDASAVNTSVVGSYSVTYDVTDANGNAAIQVTRTVDVVDTTMPVITLVGANPQVIEVGTAYSELGATALDNYDGDISGSIVIDATAVNTVVVGSYSVTYDVTDANGNNAVQVTRTVDVVDTTLPVITLVGADPQVIEVGTAHSELGATAADNYDGDISGSIVIDATAVNTAVVGSYSVTYDVDDSEGNSAVQVTRTVDVVDTTISVITLIGPDPLVIEGGGAYAEFGATALDNYDGDLTGSIVIDASAVNIAVVGSYSVTYDMVDTNGNPAVQVVRTVDVVDTTLPVITLIGANPQTIEVGSPYTELGATASDNYDGDISGSIVIDATAVNTAVVGSYPVTYDVTDANGNGAIQVTRTVDVVDTTMPVITLVGANPQVIEVGTAYSELGATALDNYDGDITGSIVIDATAVNTAVVGSYLVTYDVTDANGNNAVQVTRTVNVVDTTVPVITLVGADPQVIEVGTGYSELGATALDNYDGDITASIVIDASAVDTAVVGSYSVTYDVVDANGNNAIQVVRTVDVVDTTIPVITLVGADPQVIEVGSPYTELGATASDNYDGDITGSIVIDASAVNTAIVGSYSVTYDVADSNGNNAVQVTRTVEVVDTTIPVITLIGANPQTIEVGSPYTELGATASDNYDGDITGSIVIDASAVDTSVVGSYSVTYDVADSNGNNAVQVTRTVEVVDTTIPVITLIGANPQTIEVGSPYSELGATALDNYDGDITGSIIIASSAVNTAVAGSYTVTYDVTDANGNAAIQVTRTVDVVDTTIPLITLVGANPQTLDLGSAYVELGATAFDSLDGDLTAAIMIDASAVDTAVVGSYTVTYDVTDSDGNPAIQVVRTVDVVFFNLPPVAAPDHFVVAEDESIIVSPLDNDRDPDGDQLSIVGILPTVNGSAQIIGADVFFQGSRNFNGEVNVRYIVEDEHGAQTVADITFHVTPVNDAPHAEDDLIPIESYLKTPIDLVSNDWDVEGSPLEIVSVEPGDHVDAALDDNGHVTVHVQTGWTGTKRLTYVISDNEGGTAIGQVELVVLSSTLEASIDLSNSLGSEAVVFAAPDSGVLLYSGSSISVSLIAVSFYQTLGALQLSLSFLFISMVALALAGTSARAGATLAGSRRFTWSAVMLDREGNLGVMPAREVADPIYVMDPIATGVVGMGRVRADRSGVRWLPVDSPAGAGFVDAQFVTREVDLDAFMSDPRPARLLRRFGRNLSSGRGVARLVSRRGLIVALRDSVTVVPRTDIARWRETGPRVDAGGSIPSIRRQIIEPFIESFAATTAFTPDRPHSRSALIPTECWNFPYLALARPDDGSAWLVYFEYVRGRPRVAGIGLDV